MPVGWHSGFLGLTGTGNKVVLDAMSKDKVVGLEETSDSSTNKPLDGDANKQSSKQGANNKVTDNNINKKNKKKKSKKWAFVGTRSWRFQQAVRSRLAMLAHISSWGE